MDTASALLVDLHALGEGDVPTAGRKASTLGVLARAGLAVPEGMVLRTDALTPALDGEEGTADLPADFGRIELPDEVRAALAQVAAHFGDVPLAVRSSAVAEDTPDASWAGQYETVLGVRGLPELEQAVRICLASARSARVTAYAAGRAGDAAGAIVPPSPPPSLAVIMQRQVDADVAGVAFTADPVSGEVDRVLVSAAPGLGDGVVSGRVTPDEWIVTSDAATAVRVVHQALAEAQARAVAALARRVESVLGGPQDVEWAMSDGRLVVLQSRPITALPEPPVVDLPPGSWVKDEGHYAEPFTAFGASIAGPAVSEGLTSMFAACGGLIERFEARSVGGEIYTRVVPVGGHEGSPPPWWVLGVLARVAPPLRRRVRASARTLRPGELESQLERWEREQRPRLQAETSRLHAVDLGALDDGELAAHLCEVLEFARAALHLHFQLIPPYAVPVHHLVLLASSMLGWGEGEALELLSGTSTATTSPSRELADVAAAIGRDPVARRALEEADDDVAARLSEVDPALGADFERWRNTYGLRCLHDDPGSPTLLERPALLAQLLRQAISEKRGSGGSGGSAGSADRACAAARARAGRALAGRAPEERETFGAVLEAAIRAYPLREDSACWTSSVPCALVRLAAIEAGRRLAARGWVASPEDVVHLTADMAMDALVATNSPELRAVIRRNRAERDWTLAHPGPAFHGTPPAPMPDLRGLPGPARRVSGALLWSRTAGQTPEDAVGQPGAGLTGVAASAGTHTGRVRVIRAVGDFDQLRRGEVLVCRTTDPAWSVLFGVAGALVTDAGGILSHAAIVAREHGIPAVIGTGHASQTLHDGDVVTVDGNQGRVVIDGARDTPSKETP